MKVAACSECRALVLVEDTENRFINGDFIGVDCNIVYLNEINERGGTKSCMGDMVFVGELVMKEE